MLLSGYVSSNGPGIPKKPAPNKISSEVKVFLFLRKRETTDPGDFKSIPETMSECTDIRTVAFNGLPYDGNSRFVPLEGQVDERDPPRDSAILTPGRGIFPPYARNTRAGPSAFPVPG